MSQFERGLHRRWLANVCPILGLTLALSCFCPMVADASCGDHIIVGAKESAEPATIVIRSLATDAVLRTGLPFHGKCNGPNCDDSRSDHSGAPVAPLTITPGRLGILCPPALATLLVKQWRPIDSSRPHASHFGVDVFHPPRPV